MKDTMNCQHTLSNEVVYKEVVVIGNGPSGMVTSYMLAGNVPYLKEVPQDLPIDDMLKARLSNLPKEQSLYETDLLELAEGLEGRSHNPIPLLMDNLLRPCADMGIQADSLIEWKYDIEKQIDHVVLGRGPAGGAWHTLPGSVRTLSPAAWLSLPPHGAAAGAAGGARLCAAAVAAYCRRYVRVCNINRYFRTGVVVSSVRRAPRHPAACSSRCPLAAHYWVSGYDMCEGRGFRYACKRVILACGASDRPNTLHPHLAARCVHTLANYERALAHGGDNGAVMVVGSGLSAADAVLCGVRTNRQIMHLHRTPPDALARLSPREYPDYTQVYKMMCDGTSKEYPNYKSYPEHIIVDIKPETDPPVMPEDPEVDYETIRPKRVKLLNLVTNETADVTVSIIAVLIGSKPDLFFLQTNFNLNCIDVEQSCIKCTEKKNAKKNIEDERRQCFLRNHWLYIKSVLGQSIQSCKSRYLNYSEINGNSDTKCVIPDCNKRPEKTKCTCDEIKTEECNYEIIPSDKDKCQCHLSNPYSNGIGFGIDTKKPVDGRSNPIAIDKSTHELLNAPKGIYALGPLTGDNFVRFIPGGALAIVTHIHRERKSTE
ncbi:unnamed protein product [Diatraea saccharalis]|uniref:Oxidative stress-induced growth inhibitor 1 n=1 Tax=Diatraea saccharalis TaxID=40085 RepID=A0A9N9RBP2_9NEOP|nr:unnamed protein product [Diatraea saccharalis]